MHIDLAMMHLKKLILIHVLIDFLENVGDLMVFYHNKNVIYRYKFWYTFDKNNRKMRCKRIYMMATSEFDDIIDVHLIIVIHVFH